MSYGDTLLQNGQAISTISAGWSSDRSRSVPTTATLRLRNEAEELGKRAEKIRQHGLGQLAVREAEQLADAAKAKFEHSFHVDEKLEVNVKRARADALAKAREVAYAARVGPVAIEAAEKEANEAYKLYEEAFHEADTLRKQFANVSAL